MIKVYTDGACSGNGKEGAIGGWAFCVIGENDELIYGESGAEVNTTNNRMEFTAMLRALQWTEKNLNNNFIEYYTDSALLYNTLTQWIEGWKNNGWKRKTGELHHSYGITPTMPMYHAFLKMENDIMRTARKNFS